MSQSEPNRSVSRALGAALLGVACVLLVACGGQRISGRVVEGGIGRAMIVDAGDARLKIDLDDEGVPTTPGFEGLTVRLLRASAGTGSGPAPEVASGSTGPGGLFDLRVSDKAQLSGRMQVETSGPGIFRVRNVVFIPRADQRVLVLVRPNPATR